MTPARSRAQTRRPQNPPPAPPGVVRFATGWAGTLIAVAYVAVAGSVFVQFLPAFTGF